MREQPPSHTPMDRRDRRSRMFRRTAQESCGLDMRGTAIGRTHHRRSVLVGRIGPRVLYPPDGMLWANRRPQFGEG